MCPVCHLVSAVITQEVNGSDTVGLYPVMNAVAVSTSGDISLYEGFSYRADEVAVFIKVLDLGDVCAVLVYIVDICAGSAAVH